MNKKNAVAPANAKPLTLPNTPFPMPLQGEQPTDAVYLARVGAWYANYFLSTFRTFTRAEVGKYIHPGDFYMQNQIALLACAVTGAPKRERPKFYAPLATLLDAIAETWPECAVHVLNAKEHINRLADTLCNTDIKPGRTMVRGALNVHLMTQFAKNMNAERDGLKDDLRKLSETLLNATAARADETIKAINAVGEKVDAARGDIADVGKKLSDENDRMQQLIHDRFADLKPTQAGVDYLVGKKTQHTRNAKKAQAQANKDEKVCNDKQRAADDMHRALERVRDDPNVKAGKHGAVLAACRRVCKEFNPLTTKKNALGKFEQYAPLTDWQLKPIKPETLARNYRDSRKKPKAKRGTK